MTDYTALAEFMDLKIDIINQVSEAVDTIRRLPLDRRDRPGDFKSPWPDYVRSIHEAYGYNDAWVSLAPPTPNAITRADEAIEWMFMIDREQGRMVWARGCGVSYAKLGRVLGVSKTHAARLYRRAIDDLTEAVLVARRATRKKKLGTKGTIRV